MGGPWEDYKEDKAPWEDFSGVEQPKVPGKGESFLRGAGQGASLGFGDELSGALSAAAQVPGSTMGQKLKSAVLDPEVRRKIIRDYVAGRNEIRAKNKAAEEAHPYVYGGGQMVGAAATLPIMPEATLGKMAAMGAAQGLGGSEADLTEGDIKGAAIDTAENAALASVLTGAGKGVGKVLRADKIENAAKGAARRALGFTKGVMRKAGIGPREAEEVGGEMLKQGVITPLASVEEMAARTEVLKNKAGRAIGDFLKARGNGFETQSAVEAMNALRPVNAKGQMLRGGAYDAVNAEIDKAIDTIRAHGDIIPFEEANKLKGLFQDLVNYGSNKQEAGTGKAIASAMRKTIDKSIEETAQGVEGTNPAAFMKPVQTVSGEMSVPMTAEESQQAVQNFLKSKKTYGLASKAEDALEEKLRMEGNRKIGLTDFILGGGVAAHEGLTDPVSLIKAAVAVGAKKGIEKYGWQTAAWSAHKIADVLRENPAVFGKYAPMLLKAAKRGVQSLASTHYILQQNDPAYNELVNGQHNEEGTGE